MGVDVIISMCNLVQKLARALGIGKTRGENMGEGGGVARNGTFLLLKKFGTNNPESDTI